MSFIVYYNKFNCTRRGAHTAGNDVCTRKIHTRRERLASLRGTVPRTMQHKPIGNIPITVAPQNPPLEIEDINTHFQFTLRAVMIQFKHGGCTVHDRRWRKFQLHELRSKRRIHHEGNSCRRGYLQNGGRRQGAGQHLFPCQQGR